MKVQKLIGFDSTEDHRTYATSGGGASICPNPELPPFKDRYEVRYPLREWGFTRQDCGRIIVDAGLPLPPKSACTFCPSMKREEIEALARDDPESYALALEMERLYRAGRHFRGDDHFTVKATHKLTGEVEVIEMRSGSKQDAVARFRQLYKDTRRPHAYRVAAYPAVAGLGRNFAWGRLSLPVVG